MVVSFENLQSDFTRYVNVNSLAVTLKSHFYFGYDFALFPIVVVVVVVVVIDCDAYQLLFKFCCDCVCGQILLFSNFNGK